LFNRQGILAHLSEPLMQTPYPTNSYEMTTSFIWQKKIKE
jgi:hypothetical protein